MLTTKTCSQVLGLAVLLAVAFPIVHAQDGRDPRTIGWSEGIQLIGDDEPAGHLPEIVVDQQGDVHFFWMSWIGPDDSQPYPDAMNTIMYRREDRNGWSSSNDILVAPGNGAILIGSVIVDDQGYLNVTWVDQGQSRNVYLSRAHVSAADNARDWSTVTVDSPQSAASFPHLIVEVGGMFHLVYAKDNRAVVYLYSSDYGKTWSTPAVVWSVIEPNREAVATPRIAVDANGYLHIVWTFNTIERSWQGTAVFYSRSTDKGLNWETTEVDRCELDVSTCAWINVVVRDSDEVHLAWNRGAGSLDGRYHKWSADNGSTWTDPESFFPPFESGQTHWPWMEVDSAGVLHLISRTGGGINSGAPKYMYWNDFAWSPMYSFSETQNDLDSALTLGLGNTLHFVHAAASESGKLLYTRRLTGASPIPARPVPTMQLRVTPMPIEVLTKQPSTIGTAKLTHSPDISSSNLDTTPINYYSGYGPSVSIFIASIATLLVVLPVLLYRLVFRERSR